MCGKCYLATKLVIKTGNVLGMYSAAIALLMPAGCSVPLALLRHPPPPDWALCWVGFYGGRMAQLGLTSGLVRCSRSRTSASAVKLCQPAVLSGLLFGGGGRVPTLVISLNHIGRSQPGSNEATAASQLGHSRVTARSQSAESRVTAGSQPGHSRVAQFFSPQQRYSEGPLPAVLEAEADEYSACSQNSREEYLAVESRRIARFLQDHPDTLQHLLAGPSGGASDPSEEVPTRCVRYTAGKSATASGATLRRSEDS